jgi:hypothetical protein
MITGDTAEAMGGLIGPLVEFMLAQPGMVTRLLAGHRPDGAGRCRGCRGHDRPAPPHPCSIRLHADAADAVARRSRTTGTG